MYYSHGPYTTVFEERVPEVTYAPMKPTPEDSETSESNVYTSNLPPWADDEWLRQCFAPFGLIVSAKVMVDANGSPKGYGFIQYTDPSHAKAAVSAMHGVSVDNHWLNVKLAHRDKNKGVMNHPSNNLYVSNLPKSYGLGDLKRLFGPLPITAVTILKNPQTNTSRGVALVRLPTLQHANSAISLLNGIVLPEHDRPLEVKYAESTDEKVMRKGVEAAQAATPPEPAPRKNKERVRRRAKQSAAPTEVVETKSEQKAPPALLPKVPLPVPDKTTVVFVDGLSSEVDDLFLYHLFGPYGAIVSAKLDWNGESGKVQYVSSEDACKAVKALNGVQLQGRSLMVSLVEEAEEGPAGA